MRLINADALKRRAITVRFFGKDIMMVSTAEIDEAPTIDAVKTVRCANCKHRYMDGEVTHYYWCRLHDRPVDDTDYCAWVEERSEG